MTWITTPLLATRPHLAEYWQPAGRSDGGMIAPRSGRSVRSRARSFSGSAIRLRRELAEFPGRKVADGGGDGAVE